ncbi:hypothetical protein CEXT_71541 [Caerostris extrusa]|uniref:Uncharacterized protein n=1 Tax=Caerostris extrusa TaxID=172846 RepID=A0AAV4U1X8_CAEEX|nr:hypothetical protein CEXT_71541 [Caerostris extrusa]
MESPGFCQRSVHHVHLVWSSHLPQTLSLDNCMPEEQFICFPTRFRKLSVHALDEYLTSGIRKIFTSDSNKIAKNVFQQIHNIVG